MEDRHLSPEAEKAIDRATKLMALAKHNDNEAEATSAMDAALRILEAYNLDVALVERRSGDTSARKREDKKSGGGLYKWQRTVWNNVAELNFCRYVAIKGLKAGSKYENRVIGSTVNVLATTLMADYLQGTIERMAAQWVKDNRPAGTSRFIRDAIAYREGMADTIGNRLRDLRWKREREEEERQKNAPRGDGTSLVLADVVHAEQDANDDVLQGYEPGTHARWRAERNARRAAADAEYQAQMAARDEREKADPVLKEQRIEEERRAKEKADAENEAWWRKHGAKYARRPRERKSDQPRSHTYYDGRRAGEDVGLDPQVTDRRNSNLRIK